MPKISWDTYFMKFANVAKERSSCVSRHVGAVLVRDKRVIATGYNDTPAGITNCGDGGCERCTKSSKEAPIDLGKCACSHAEENAIVQAALHGVSTKDAVLYTTHTPCTICAKMIINAKISKVIAGEKYPDDLGTQLLREAGIRLILFREE